jgi:D-threo-aldose 1-dehydrogenase
MGNMFGAIDEAQAAGTLEAAWECGIRYFDTAPHYGAGLSEHRFGTVLRQFPRESFVLSSKVGRVLTPDPAVTSGPWPFEAGLPFRARYDYSADGATRSIEDSLQRLGLARLDVVYVHDVAEDAHGPPWREVLTEAMRGAGQALTRLREEGVIRAWGLGVNRVEACLAALEQADPDVFLLAGRFSRLDQGALDALFPACMDRGVHVVIGGPFNSGLLAGGTHYDYVDAPGPKRAARDRIAAVCRRYGVDLRAVALQFCAAHPIVCSVIPGSRHPDRVRQNVALMRAQVPQAVWAELKSQSLLRADAPVPGC